MHYIIFDLEWNQPSVSDKIDYKNGVCMNGEVIQIGAVRVSENKEVLDEFSVYIKPTKYKHLNRMVKKLTGIDEDTLSNADSFEKAIEKFRNWCGSEYIFLTWGYDDIDILGNNLRYLGIDTSWLPKCYNLQMIFCSQTDSENRQYALSYAVEHFSIQMDKPFHNALADAYYTALVASKLDINKGVDTYNAIVFNDKSIPEYVKNIRYKKAYRSLVSIDRLIEVSGIYRPQCCDCQKPLTDLKKYRSGMWNYLTIGKCEEHGEFAVSLKASKSKDDKFNGSQYFYQINDANRDYFKKRIIRMKESERKRRLAEKQKKDLMPAN